MVSPSDVKLAAGGLRIRHNVNLGWQITPSIGLVARDIDRLGLDIKSFKEPLTTSVKKVIIPSIRRNFDQGGRPEWPPLSEVTIKIRGEAWPILRRTGKLRKAATRFNIWDIGQTSATVRRLPDTVWYGALHQAGFGGPGTNVEFRIPQRRFIMFQEDDVDDIYEVFYEWLSDRVRRVGGFT